jgi:hypothetical protein
MIQQAQYLTVENRPIACSFCGATVNGKVTERMDYNSKETVKECRWTCPRCSNLVKVGVVK